MSERRNPYLFVVGCPRSGTTLLQRMLNAHPDLAVANDSHFITRAVKRLDRGRLAHLDEEIVALVRQYRRFYRLGLDDHSVDGAAASASSYPDFVAALYDRLAEKEGKPFAGEKTPDYCRSIPFLAELFPWAYFVHIVRDGRDVALSTVDWAKDGKGPSSWPTWVESKIATCALWWKWQVESGMKDGRRLGNRYTEISYEKLVVDPESVLGELCERINLPFRSEMLAFSKGKRRKGSDLSAKSAWLPATAGLRDWRTQMEDGDVELFESLAGGLLGKCGYERRYPDAERERMLEAAAMRRKAHEKITYRSSIERRKERVMPPPPDMRSGDEEPSDRDLAVVRRDRSLSGLGVALSGRQMLERLAPFLYVDVDSLVPVYVRYKPGMNCLVGYEAILGGECFWLYAKCFRADDQSKMLKATVKRNENTRFGPSVVVLDDLDVVVRLFPNDAKLAELWRFHDDVDRKLIGRLFDNDAGLAGASFELIRWKPERRLVARMLVDGQPHAALKFMAPRTFDRIWSFQRHRSLLAGVNAPRILGASKRVHAIAYEWLDGDVASEYLARADANMEQVDAVADALIDLHAMSPRNVPTVLPGQVLGQTRAAVSAMGGIAPELASRAEDLFHRLAGVASNAESDLVFVHGDFYAKQVLLTKDRPAILDFDAAGMGDRHLDIANFIAHLHRDALRDRITSSKADEIESRFLDGYRARYPAFDRRTYATQVAAALLRLMPHPFRFRESDWFQKTEEILDRAARYLRHTQNISSYPVQAPLEVLLERATDKRSVQEAFSGLAELDGAAAVDLAEIVRYKPGRRCLVRYRMAPSNGSEAIELLGKIRAKGLDQRTFEITRELYQNGFSAEASDGIQVPKPVGCIPELNMWLQQAVQGIPLDQILIDDGDFRWGERVANAIRKLHRLGPATDRVHGMEDEMAILRTRLSEVATRRPESAERISRLIESCGALAETVGPVRQSPVHRDFHLSQVLFTADATYLVDLDLYAMGDPAVDIGNFVAHVRELSLRATGEPGAYDSELDRFLAVCLDQDDDTLPHRVRVYSWLSLARHVWISDKLPDRRFVTKRLLELCETGMTREFAERPIVATS